ncbi:MAG: FecR family protein [Candidatus Acidiferrales bacterium]
MNSRHPFFSVLAILVCLPLLIPADLAAQATQPQHAGKITAVLPIVNLIRGPRQTPASTSEEVFWGDVINTGHLARARVALDDGSVLNVGSDTNLAVAQHDATNQQTDLDLNYGRVRATAAALVKPNAHFRVRTPVGVAGVVGTIIGVFFDPTSGTMQVVCLEGTCQVCDLAGNCVIMKGGQQSSVHGNSAPSQPVPATPMNVTDAVTSTNATGATGVAGGVSAAGATAIGIGAAVAVTVATVVVRSVSKTPTCPAPTAAQAAHVAPEPSCAARSQAAIGRAPGQRP